MPNDQAPSDDVLRLILAADQEDWLLGRINESRGWIWAMSFLLVVSLAWGTTHYKDAFAYFDEPKCFVLIGEPADNQQMRDMLLAQGLTPCPQEGSEQDLKEKEIGWRDVQAMATFAAWLMVLASTLTLFRHIYQLRKFKGYLEDHRAFLAKYNRLKTNEVS